MGKLSDLAISKRPTRVEAMMTMTLTFRLEGEDGWQIPGHAAVMLRPIAREEHEAQ
jgi:hypothetical protein